LSADPPLPRGAWLVVALLWFAGALNYADRTVAITMHQSIVAAIPMTEAQFGLITSVFLIVYGVLSPGAGFLADRYSRRGLVLTSVLAWSVATWLTAYATTFDQLLATRVLLAVSQAAYLPASLALIADYHRGATRSLATGIHMVGIMAGTILASTGGWIADWRGWTFAFWSFGLAGVLLGLVMVFTLRATPREGVDDAPADRPAGAPSFFPALASLARSGSFLLALAVWGLLGLSGWAIIGWMPTYVQEHFHLGQGASGFTALSYGRAAGIVGLVFGGAWSDRWSKTNPRSRILVPIIGLCVQAPAVLLSVHTDYLGVTIFAFIVGGLAGNFSNSNMMPILCDVVDPRYRSTAYGVLNAFSCMVGALTIYLAGALRDHHVGLSGIFGFSAGSLLVCAGLLYGVRLRRTVEISPSGRARSG
jgi:predicted MFS family arabinose efflux permease